MRRRKADEAGWAAFNIETDGNQFDFVVALGGTVVGFRDPDSTCILRTRIDETATCRVSIQKAGHLARDAARRLEVLSPLYEDSELRELDCVAQCGMQLSTALRLYKSNQFAIVPWGQRNAAKARLTFNDGKAYVLKGVELRKFLEFSGRLRDFHVSRNLFHHARFLPDNLDGDVRELLGGSRRDEARVLESQAHLMIATDLFEQALRDWTVARELQLVLLIMAAEALFGDDDKAELAFRLSLRMAVLNGGDDAHRRKLFEVVRSCYDMRNRLVHGSWYRRSKGFVRVSDVELLTLTNLVRASILYSWAVKDTGKGSLLQTLDRAIFDRGEVDGMRAGANRYWGLEGDSEERIYAARWGAGSA